MFSTDIGPLDGKSWERLCQSTLKIKYSSIGYQEIPASPGDFGIDGLISSTGDVYQCYSPEQNYPHKELYENQRSKITDDIGKLKTYEKEIKQLLNGVKIKRWIFLTPIVTSKELRVHCNKKTNELKESGISFIDPEIEVLIHDYEYLNPELQFSLSVAKQKLDFKSNLQNHDSMVETFQKNKPSLINNALSKHTARFQTATQETKEKVDKFVYHTVDYFLKGEDIIKKWETSFEVQYQNFIRVVNNFENEVEDLCINPAEDNNQRYLKIREDLKKRLTNEFSDSLSESMIDELTHHVIADWILRCPLSF